MTAKVLKLDIVVDENGNAARKLEQLEGGVKKVESAAAGGLKPALDSTKASLAGTATEAQALSGGLSAVEAATGMSTVALVGWTGVIGGAMAAAAAAGAVLYQLGVYVKDSSEYYIEQSGVLEVNRGAIEHLKQTWYDLQYVIGEVTVGGDGDFRGWIGLVEAGMITIGLRIGANILLLKELARYVNDPLAIMEDVTGVSGNPGDLPGIDTTMRNRDGSPTPYAIVQRQRERAMNPWTSGADPLGLNMPEFNPALAEAMTMKQISEEKRAQLDLEREQQRAARERLQMLNEQAKIQNELTNAIQRSKEAVENEIDAARKLNETKIQTLDLSMRDAIAKSMMSPGDFNEFSRNAALDRKIAAIDPRASNSDELRRRYEAERQLGGIQQRQGAEGFTQAIADELHAFKIQYSDIIGELPSQFAAVIPEIATASGAMRESLTADLDAVQGAQQRTIGGYHAIAAATYHASDAVRALEAADRMYRDAGFFIQQDMNVDRYRNELSRRAANTVAPSSGRWGAPTVNVDARGAQFSDEASMDRLANKVQSRIAAFGERVQVS